MILTSLNLEAAERALCIAALNEAGTIAEAAKLLGIRRDALRRRIVKLKIDWKIQAPRTRRPS